MADDSVTLSLKVNVGESQASLSEMLHLLRSSASLLRKLGLPDNIQAGLMQVQRMIIVLNLLQRTIEATYVSMGPLGWVLLGISWASTIVTMVDLT